jgi:hypothetical protein
MFREGKNCETKMRIEHKCTQIQQKQTDSLSFFSRRRKIKKMIGFRLLFAYSKDKQHIKY